MTELKKIESESKHPLAAFADQFNLNPETMKQTLISTVFRQKEGNPVTDEQMTALMIVAKEYKLNPFIKEIYAFPDKSNGIIPIIGVDGWLRIINSHPKLSAIEFEYADEMIKMDDNSKRCPEWIECIITRSDRDKPIKVREYLDEVYRPAFTGYKNGKQYTITGPWQTHTKRQLRTKAIIQAARIAFGFSGIYEEDEAHRILEQQEREVNPIIEEQPDPNEAPVSQSRTEELNSKLKSRGKKVFDKTEAEEVEVEKAGEQSAPENTTDDTPDETAKPKRLTKKVVESLKDKIGLCESAKEMNKLAAEIAQYDVKNEKMKELRELWSARKEEIMAQTEGETSDQKESS